MSHNIFDLYAMTTNIFDLHGMTTNKTKELIKKKILNNKNAQNSYTLITGKGNHSSNGPVLAGYIREIIKNANNFKKNNIPGWDFYWIIDSTNEGRVILKKNKLIDKNNITNNSIIKYKKPTKQIVIKKTNAWNKPLKIN